MAPRPSACAPSTSRSGPRDGAWTGKVIHSENLGSDSYVYVDIGTRRAGDRAPGRHQTASAGRGDLAPADGRAGASLRRGGQAAGAAIGRAMNATPMSCVSPSAGAAEAPAQCLKRFRPSGLAAHSATSRRRPTMPIRATVWGENVHEQKNKAVAENYPKGMHGQIAALLSEDKNIDASTVTLQDPEHGMTEAEARRDRRAGLVGPRGARPGRRRDRRARRGARLGGHGADRAPLRPPLEDLQAADGRAGEPALARGGRARAALGGQPGPSDRQGAAATISSSRTKRCTASRSRVPEPLETVFISWFQGGEVFRSGLTYRRGAGNIFYFRPGHETYPTYHDKTVGKVLRNAVQLGVQRRAPCRADDGAEHARSTRRSRRSSSAAPS